MLRRIIQIPIIAGLLPLLSSCTCSKHQLGVYGMVDGPGTGGHWVVSKSQQPAYAAEIAKQLTEQENVVKMARERLSAVRNSKPVDKEKLWAASSELDSQTDKYNLMVYNFENTR